MLSPKDLRYINRDSLLRGCVVRPKGRESSRAAGCPQWNPTPKTGCPQTWGGCAAAAGGAGGSGRTTEARGRLLCRRVSKPTDCCRRPQRSEVACRGGGRTVAGRRGAERRCPLRKRRALQVPGLQRVRGHTYRISLVILYEGLCKRLLLSLLASRCLHLDAVFTNVNGQVYICNTQRPPLFTFVTARPAAAGRCCCALPAMRPTAGRCCCALPAR